MSSSGIEIEDSRGNILTSVSNDEEQGEILFILNLEIKHGKMDKIVYREHSNPRELALKFCQKNALNIKVYDFVVDALRAKFNQVLTQDQPEHQNSLEQSEEEPEENFENFSSQIENKKNLAKEPRKVSTTGKKRRVRRRKHQSQIIEDCEISPKVLRNSDYLNYGKLQKNVY